MRPVETRVLARSRSVALHDVRCSATTRAPGDEEEQPAFSLAIPMAGVYVHRVDGRDLVGSPGAGLCMNPGEVYRTSHPAGSGDRTIELAFPAESGMPIGDGTVPASTVPVPLVVDLEVRELARVAGRHHVTALELDERVHRIVGCLFARPDAGPTTGQRRAIVDRALEYLAWHFAEDADLPTVAAAVGSSPHHLSRVFHAGTGVTLSRHRTELRLRAALERIEGGASDLSGVASDVGFFDHAHMTRTFRRVLGRTPTAVRAALAAGGG
jgi:AraC-like DNA-binding protein